MLRQRKPITERPPCSECTAPFPFSPYEKVARSAGPHNVYGFLTTTLNAVVRPIHPKVMPVILMTDEERCLDASPMG